MGEVYELIREKTDMSSKKHNIMLGDKNAAVRGCRKANVVEACELEHV